MLVLLRWMISGCAALAVLLVVVGAAHAQEKRIALLIGNSGYSSKVGPLKNPGNDIAGVRTALIAAGFRPDDIRVVANATRLDVKREVDAFAGRASKLTAADVAFFYYSGHGAWRPGSRSMSLIPIDATDAATEDFWYSTINLDDEVLRTFNASRSQAAWMIAIDACRNELRLPTRDLGGSGDKAFGVMPSQAGMLISFAADEGQTARDIVAGESYSPYAASLIDSLKVPGLSASTLFSGLRPAVMRRTGGAQQPVLTNKLNVDPILSVATSRAAPVVTADDPAARSAAVRRLQQSLKTLGQYSGAADGATGSATRSAAQAFATAQRIAAPDLAAAPIAAIEAFAARAEQAALVSTTQEAAAWRVAKDADTRSPLDAYLRDFPNGPNAAAARTRIAALTRLAAPSRAARKTFSDCTDCPTLESIPAGSFMMGSPASEAGRFDSEGPQRRVSVPAFAAGMFEVTWNEYTACVSAGGCAALTADGFGGGSRPVTNVSWNEAVAYTKWLSNKTGQTYRLLSEAEWEYAARAGNSGRWSFGENEGSLGSYVWSLSNSGSATHAVGTKTANAFGLHDMHGNVWEWVQDCYAENYSAGQPSNGSAYTSGSCSVRVSRGGSWGSGPQSLRSAYRNWSGPTGRSGSLGFRVARTL